MYLELFKLRGAAGPPLVGGRQARRAVQREVELERAAQDGAHHHALEAVQAAHLAMRVRGESGAGWWAMLMHLKTCLSGEGRGVP